MAPYKNWAAIAGVKDPGTKFELCLVSDPGVLYMIKGSHPEYFQNEPTIPMPLSELKKLQFKLHRADEVNKGESDQDLLKFSDMQWHEACQEFKIPLLDFGPCEPGGIRPLGDYLLTPPEFVTQLQNYQGSEQAGGILTIRNVRFVLVGDEGLYYRGSFRGSFSVAPLECIDLEH